MASQRGGPGLRVTMLIDPWAVQDGLGIDLVWSFFRLAVWDRFFGPLGLLLGSFLGTLGVVLGFGGSFLSLLGLVFGSPRPFWGLLGKESSLLRLFPSTLL